MSAQSSNPTSNYSIFQCLDKSVGFNTFHTGTILDNLQILQLECFPALDFDNIWSIDSDKNGGLPYIQNLIPRWREGSTEPISPDVYEGKAWQTAIPVIESEAVIVDSNQSYFLFTPAVSGIFVFESFGDYSTIGRIYDSSYNLLSSDWNESFMIYRFCIFIFLSAQNDYYLRIGTLKSSENNGELSFRISNIESISNKLYNNVRKYIEFDDIFTRNYYEIEIINSSTYTINIEPHQVAPSIMYIDHSGKFANLGTKSQRTIDNIAQYDYEMQSDIKYFLALCSYKIGYIDVILSISDKYDSDVTLSGDCSSGDINGDGYVTMDEVIKTYRVSIGDLNDLNTNQIAAIDMDKDGFITMFDVMQVYKKAIE